MSTEDRTTKATSIVAYAHHEIHEGSHFQLTGYAVIPINNVYDIQWTTPNTLSWAHVTWALTTTDTLTFEIYENVNIILAGTALTSYNNNRNSTKTSAQVIKSIANTSVANANLDTAVAGATKIWEGQLGSNQVKGVSERSDAEIILRQNEDYCFRAIGTAGSTIYFRMFWYEHTNKYPISNLRSPS